MLDEFRYEKDLQSHLADLELDLAGDHIVTFYRREVNMGSCIPDMIYVRFKDVPDRHLWPRNNTYRHAHIIWLLRKYGRQTTRELASHGFSHFSKFFQGAIKDLMKAEAIFEHDDGSVELSDAMLGVTGEVITVEAKLKRWRQALEQAILYKAWSDYVFVVMDAKHTPTKPRVLNEFRAAGVGLCSLSPESTKLDWSIQPQKINEKNSFDKEYLIAAVTCPRKQAYWDVRNRSNALRQTIT